MFWFDVHVRTGGGGKISAKTPMRALNPGTSQTQIAQHHNHSLSKTTERGAVHKVLVSDVPRLGSRTSQRLGP